MKRTLRFLKAVFKYIFFGNTVTFEKYTSRILTCNTCEYRKISRCGICKCILIKKAKWSTEDCPKNKW